MVRIIPLYYEIYNIDSSKHHILTPAFEAGRKGQEQKSFTKNPSPNEALSFYPGSSIFPKIPRKSSLYVLK